MLSESYSLRKRRFPSVFGTVEVGLYVWTNRQVVGGFRTKMANFADMCPDKKGSDRRKFSSDLYGYPLKLRRGF